MKRADHMCDGIGGPVRMDLHGMPAGTPGIDDDGTLSLVFDFPAREIRVYDGEQARYRWGVPATLVATNIATGEVDWSNSLFLSVRFTATRVGQYNEYLYTFFKCLSEERMDYVENWYDAQNDDGRDIELDGWRVQARCPHLSADLSKFGAVDGDVLTCTLHNWKFNLATGRCLTSAGHEIPRGEARRVRRTSGDEGPLGRLDRRGAPFAGTSARRPDSGEGRPRLIEPTEGPFAQNPGDRRAQWRPCDPCESDPTSCRPPSCSRRWPASPTRRSAACAVSRARASTCAR